MQTESRTIDSNGALVLPISFANATVMIEHISDSEILVKKVGVAGESDLPFVEESGSPLSDRDRDRFLELLTNPAAPHAALKRAAARHKARGS
jgi:hypothetical protein